MIIYIHVKNVMAHNKNRNSERNGQYNQKWYSCSKKTLTHTNNISKANKEPSIQIITGDTNKPKIISDDKEWNVEDLEDLK